ncbi:MAG: LLM class flavin-dependent oxidoreductase [Betaproteobacteria bacterium]|nr:LLM class flavin-dependent oxidoreductase [Betaproteobacteria bacterium]
MSREILLNAFDMNCVGHIQQGLWTHPRDQATRYLDLAYWTELAKTLEDGLFDGLFLADVIGVYDVFGGNADAALRGAVQVPVNDPMLLIPAMAAATTHLGFGVTANLLYEAPYLFARRMSTLDHLTRGRVGWNIVTGYLDSAARAAGFSTQPAHDDRYDLADEYMSLVYKLWEQSWDNDAVRADRHSGIYADPAKVRAVHHHGKQYRVDAIHLSEPSPQRTPVLYQAGSSPRGRRFAASHAECVFLNGQGVAGVKAIIDDIRAQACAVGRSPADIKAFLGVTVVTGATEAEARDKFDDYRQYVSSEAALVHAAASLGVDLARFDLDEPVDTSASQAITSNADAMARRHGPQWTRRKLLEQMVLGSRQAPLVGAAGAVAEALIGWTEDAGVDGFNLSRTVAPECFADFGRLVVPELQSRGAFKTAYRPGSLRQKLFGQARLPDSHPARG